MHLLAQVEVITVLGPYHTCLGPVAQCEAHGGAARTLWRRDFPSHLAVLGQSPPSANPASCAQDGTLPNPPTLYVGCARSRAPPPPPGPCATDLRRAPARGCTWASMLCVVGAESVPSFSEARFVGRVAWGGRNQKCVEQDCGPRFRKSVSLLTCCGSGFLSLWFYLRSPSDDHPLSATGLAFFVLGLSVPYGTQGLLWVLCLGITPVGLKEAGSARV